MPTIGERFREWFEAPSYEEGVGDDGRWQGSALQKGVWGGVLPKRKNVFYGMKAMLKSELALKAGVSVTTLMRWCKPFREELARMGMQPRNRVLPPHIVQFLAEKFCIDV